MSAAANRGHRPTPPPDQVGAPEPPDWLTSTSHRAWLFDQSLQLLEFFRPTLDPSGVFVELDDEGRTLSAPGPAGTRPQQLLTVTRAVHSYALGELLGVPGCARIVERGLEAIVTEHHDDREGGYLEVVGGDPSLPPVKAAYGHAFVALAASSALTAGHERAALLLEDVLEVIDEHFWSDAEGATRESFSPTWDHPEAYRGANSNMHMCEALLAASVAARRPELAGRAVRITERLIDGEARPRDWMLPEHYGPDWSARLDYNRDRPDDPFRPYGVTMGHLFEWARLLCLAWLATGRSDAWLVESARQLFDRATSVGWDEVHGGIIYTSDFDGTPVNDDHYWWPVAEAIATSAVLASITGDRSYARWYRVFWDFAGTYLIDHRRGGWYAQLDATNERKSGPWYGKPDLYHVLQACIIPATPLSPSVAGSLAGGARVGPEPA